MHLSMSPPLLSVYIIIVDVSDLTLLVGLRKGRVAHKNEPVRPYPEHYLLLTQFYLESGHQNVEVCRWYRYTSYLYHLVVHERCYNY